MRDSYNERPSDDDDLVTTNDQLNSALARNDAELELFEKMDENEENVCTFFFLFFFFHYIIIGGFLNVFFGINKYCRNGRRRQRRVFKDLLALFQWKSFQHG